MQGPRKGRSMDAIAPYNSDKSLNAPVYCTGFVKVLSGGVRWADGCTKTRPLYCDNFNKSENPTLQEHEKETCTRRLKFLTRFLSYIKGIFQVQCSSISLFTLIVDKMITYYKQVFFSGAMVNMGHFCILAQDKHCIFSLSSTE